MTTPDELTYGRYLRLDALLGAQQPLTGEHDELLFIVIHQVYELWFKQLLQELGLLQQQLESGNTSGALRTTRRVATVLKTVVGQLDVLETMTPRQFAAFRPELGGSSGFQSEQFRVIEAVLGRRDLPPSDDPALAAAVSRRPVFASLLRYLTRLGYDVPADALAHDPRTPWQADAKVQALLNQVYAEDDAPAARVCEALVDIDEGLQEWRYRHAQMVERVIGDRRGTGGSSGIAYLRSTCFRPAFPDLWAMRSQIR